MMNCPICGEVSQSGYVGDVHHVTCPRCGSYRISGTALAALKANLPVPKRKIANLSGWIREHQNELITNDTMKSLEHIQTPSIADRGIKLLRYLEMKTSYAGERIYLAFPNKMTSEFYAASWAENHEEYVYIFQHLEKRGFLLGTQITPEGFAYLDKEKYSNAESQMGFCAMWFAPEWRIPQPYHPDMKVVWKDAINPAILAAGYEPKRIDEHHHNNRIDDEIIVMIRRSKFVVADFTGQRGGVYFEAGFALGMNLPVIWTVEKSELEKIHFDNRQYNFVTWEEDKLPEFQKALQMRIESTLGRGKYQPT